ncbi:2-hydroxyacyl-CoA dehydratase [Seleniivibrio sp.]|uniref:2-hydroxyacyl-CoA dehydratase family protein n=1 Tax=Seleniivibrio sp. TaxID=2898801 RepID=UPI0025FE5FB8|nr:2-hydroxyacyl-CoA dehydratase [Seleniivibrio sp.]MCD8553374.1 2-hydroxyacyl-CoA dehydratase [Seleniivibrio sp.]
MSKVGFTTTIPVEIVLAAGKIPVDLNNVFITDHDPIKMAEEAEDEGLPRNLCAWIKGIYTAVKKAEIDEVVAVTQGDCSNSHALAELFISAGIKVHSFSYPFEKESRYDQLKTEMERFAKSVGTTLESAVEYSKYTDPVRDKLRKLDRMTVEGHVSGFENHLWLVSSTDFNTSLSAYEKDLDDFLSMTEGRFLEKDGLRIGFIGVPTIFSDIYQFVESKGARVVFNEIQRQFAIPSNDPDYVQRYVDYTYPYDVFGRVEDIQKAVDERRLDGIVHYVQSFCYRQMQDITIRKNIKCPILTIEGDAPGGIDARTKIRIESFLEMLVARKQ